MQKYKFKKMGCVFVIVLTFFGLCFPLFLTFALSLPAEHQQAALAPSGIGWTFLANGSKVWQVL